MSNTITTAVPDIVFTEQGISLPPVSDIIDGVLTDWDDAVGGGINKDLRTPQGQDATSRGLIIARDQAWFAALVSQIDPNNASGRIQDAIGKMYFLTRYAGRGTVVKATCQGSAGTFIPQGSIVQDAAGFKYASLSAVIIGELGEVEVDFQNLTIGPIPCGVNELNQIVSQVSGWSSVFNDTIGALGTDVESRQAFEYRRRASVEKNARDTIGAVEANVAAVDGVIDWHIRENFESTPQTVGTTSYVIAPKSLYVCVSGGLSTDIANAIWNAKAGGCGVNGDVTVTIEDKRFPIPYPTYDIKYQQAIPTQAYFRVTITNNPALPSDIVSQIQKAVVAAFTGADGGQRIRIGANLNAGSFFNAIYSVDEADIDLQLIEVSLDNATWTTRVTFGIDQAPATQETNITVVLA